MTTLHPWILVEPCTTITEREGKPSYDVNLGGFTRDLGEVMPTVRVVSLEDAKLLMEVVRKHLAREIDSQHP